jgi:hypothetical protein
MGFCRQEKEKFEEGIFLLTNFHASVIDLNLLFRAPAGGNAGATGGGQASQQGILRFYTDEAPGFQM